MLGELTHLQTISEDLKALTSDPHKLPPACEQVKRKYDSYIYFEGYTMFLNITEIIYLSALQVITDLKASDYGWLYHTPPSSPSTTMSRKSSMCR